jgi:hypothetical protein
MSTQWYDYQDDGGTHYGVQLTDAQQAIYTAAIGTLSTGYATFAALQTAIPSAISLPAGLSLRKINITSPFFGTAQLMVLTPAQYDAVYPTGNAPFPLASFAYTDSPAITGATGETRLSN